MEEGAGGGGGGGVVRGSGKGVQNLMGLYTSHNGWDHYGSWLVILRNQNQTLNQYEYQQLSLSVLLLILPLSN